MAKKKKILFLFTGGTINSGYNENTKFVRPNKKTFKLLHKYIEKSFNDPNIELLFREPLGIPGKDSSNIQPDNWIEISSIIAEEIINGIDGILILFGTDTMAYFSAWLSLCFPDINIPIIITGSQLTLDYKTEDITVNLTGAFQVVISDFPGIWIYCNWKLIPGSHAHKSRASHPDMFVASNDKVVDFEPKLPKNNQKDKSKYQKKYRLSKELKVILKNKSSETKIYQKIRWLMCMPGLEPIIEDNYRIICIYGFGAGNAPSNVLDYLETFYSAKEKPYIIACSQAERDVKKPEYYEGVGIATLSKNGFKVWSQLDYPIEFIHALAVFSLLSSPDNPGPVLSKYLEGPFKNSGS